MIKVDGRNYDVVITEVNLSTEFIYKYAERTRSYELKYELGGIFFNQSLTFGPGESGTDFSDLWNLLSSKGNDGGTGHSVEIWTPIGKLTFQMYPGNISVKMMPGGQGGRTWWNGMKVDFISVKPARS